MSLQKAVANALSFAHLGGIGRGKMSKAAAEDDEDKKDAKAEAEEEDDEKKDDKSAEGEDDDAKAEDDKPDEKDDDKKDAKAKAEDDDEEDKDEEMRGKSAAAQARLREQARCAAIFASPAAARNPVLAANLAFKGRMPRREAVALLEGTPAPAAASHVSRSARNPQVGAGGDMKTTPQQAAAARWDQHLQAAAKVGRR